MSRKHKMNRNNNVITPPQKNKRNVFVAAGIVLVVAAVVGLGLWWWITAKSDFEKLQGKWVRTDGGYVLEIKKVAADGNMDAAYLNPRPINVSKATASSEAGQTKVFVELRDRLYPGNYYTLAYDRGKDQLSGMYYHLGIGQQFDVVFARMK
jgi:flagellar basal body-associated protein FliL